MAFKQSCFLVLVLLAFSAVLGKVESGPEVTETTNAVKIASRKLLPMGGQIIQMLGVAVDGLGQRCAPYMGNCVSLACCEGCVCRAAQDGLKLCYGVC